MLCCHWSLPRKNFADWPNFLIPYLEANWLLSVLRDDWLSDAIRESSTYKVRNWVVLGWDDLVNVQGLSGNRSGDQLE